MLMMRPKRRSTMCRPKMRQARSVPVRLVSRIASQSASATSSVGARAVRPAALTRMSTLPHAALIHQLRGPGAVAAADRLIHLVVHVGGGLEVAGALRGAPALLVEQRRDHLHEGSEDRVA